MIMMQQVLNPIIAVGAAHEEKSWKDADAMLALLRAAYEFKAHLAIRVDWRSVLLRLGALLGPGKPLPSAKAASHCFGHYRRRMTQKYRDLNGNMAMQPAADADDCEKLMHRMLVEAHIPVDPALAVDPATPTVSPFSAWQDGGFLKTFLTLTKKHSAHHGHVCTHNWQKVSVDIFTTPPYCQLRFGWQTLHMRFRDMRSAFVQNYFRAGAAAGGGGGWTVPDPANELDTMMYDLIAADDTPALHAPTPLLYKATREMLKAPPTSQGPVPDADRTTPAAAPPLSYGLLERIFFNATAQREEGQAPKRPAEAMEEDGAQLANKMQCLAQPGQ